MRIAAAVLLGLAVAACGADSGAAQQTPPRVTVTDLRGTPTPSFDGRLLISDRHSVFGMIVRSPRDPATGLMVVEMLTSQTASQVHLGGAKIDAMSFVYDLDCATMRYRLAHQVMYERTGRPVSQTNLDNTMIDGPMASYLQPACGREASGGVQTGETFASMEAFLAAADLIEEPYRANLPRPTITVTPRRGN